MVKVRTLVRTFFTMRIKSNPIEILMLSHPLFRMLVTILFLFNSLFPLWYQSTEFWWITMILSIRPLYESVKVEVKTMLERCGEER